MGPPEPLAVARRRAWVDRWIACGSGDERPNAFIEAPSKGELVRVRYILVGAALVGALVVIVGLLALVAGDVAKAKDLADVAQKTAATAAIVIGAAWAYFKFVATRQLRTKIESAITANVREASGRTFLFATLEAKNISDGKIDLQMDYSVLTVRGMTVEKIVNRETPESPPTDAEKYGGHHEPIDVIPIVPADRPLIEPEETLAADIVIEIPKPDSYMAVELEMQIVSTKNDKWTLNRIIPL